MPALLILGAAGVYASLWLVYTALFNPAPIARTVDRVAGPWARRRGPQPQGQPIEQIAADLRRLMREHDRLVRPQSDWHRAHHVKACELALRDRAEDAARALGLPLCQTSAERWTTADLAHRLRQLASAGLVLPEIAGMGNDLR